MITTTGLALLAGVLVLLGATGPAGAPSASAATPGLVSSAHSGARQDVSDFTFASFHGDYTISRGSTGAADLRAVESFVAEFPEFDQNKGIVRAIPDVFNGAPLHTKVVSVTDDAGTPVQWDVDRDGDFVTLSLGSDDYVRGTQSYVITYTQENVVGAYQDTRADEFYWDAPGTGWDQPFAAASVSVHVDRAVSDALTGNAACYRGNPDDSSSCDITRSSGDTSTAGASFVVPDVALAPRQTLTVAIGFAPGTFTQPERPRDWPVFQILPVVLLTLSAAGLAIVGTIRVRLWRDHPGRGIIVPQYSVPKDINLMMSGDLIGRSGSAMAATIVSLAVRGAVRILDYPVTAEGAKVAKQGRAYSLQLLAPVLNDGTGRPDIAAIPGLDEQERTVLGMLFPGGRTIREMGVVDTTLGQAVRTEISRTHTAAVNRGFRRRVAAVTSWIVVGALLLVGVAAFVVHGIADSLHAGGGITIIGLLVCGGALFVAAALAIAPQPLTETGADERDYLIGMRDYLKLAEADRFRVLQSPQGAERTARTDHVDPGDPTQVVKLYEKLLPFAVLWGVEREWVRELAIRYERIGETPAWYGSNSPFTTALFINSFSGFAGGASSTTASWSTSGGASSSGGSTGGGFAGGGGGGGGGGGR